MSNKRDHQLPRSAIPLTAMAILAFTLFIVSIQVMKAAIANPVNSLKSE